PGSRVLDVGCASGVVSEALWSKGCRVTGIDRWPLAGQPQFERFIQHDLNNGALPVDAGEFDHILLLDVIEHLESPEAFVDALRRCRTEGRPTRVFVTTG